MFTFDDDYVYTWELKRGRLVRPLRLKIFECTGQIINTPLDEFTFFNHSAIVLGYDTESFLKPIYVCGKNMHGYEIRQWAAGRRATQLKYNPSISQKRCLQRLANFLNSRQYNFSYPAYNVTISNCQNFSHGMVYGGDIHVALTLAILIFLVVFFAVK